MVITTDPTLCRRWKNILQTKPKSSGRAKLHVYMRPNSCLETSSLSRSVTKFLRTVDCSLFHLVVSVSIKPSWLERALAFTNRWMSWLITRLSSRTWQICFSRCVLPSFGRLPFMTYAPRHRAQLLSMDMPKQLSFLQVNKQLLAISTSLLLPRSQRRLRLKGNLMISETCSQRSSLSFVSLFGSWTFATSGTQLIMELSRAPSTTSRLQLHWLLQQFLRVWLQSSPPVWPSVQKRWHRRTLLFGICLASRLLDALTLFALIKREL